MVGPGAYGMGGDSNQAVGSSVYLERMCTDIGSLKKQYSKLKQRQTQAHVIIAGQYSIAGQCSNHSIAGLCSNHSIAVQCSIHSIAG